MNLLQIVQEFCSRTGLAVPSAVVGSSDRQIIQIQSLLNEICEDLARWDWQEVTLEATFTTVAAESQGLLSTIAPTYFQSIVNGTVYDRTQKLQMTGPVSAQEWQAIKALSYSGSVYRWRINQNRFLMTPTPVAGHTVAFEYISSAFIYNPVDLVYKQSFTKDTDNFLLDQRLIVAGLRWRWKAEKSLSYAEEMRAFEELAANLASRSGGTKTLNISGGNAAAVPGIMISPGSWPL